MKNLINEIPTPWNQDEYKKIIDMQISTYT